ncbi:MAG: ammonium transporter [Epsilonproteobacteria bacterium]|nr:ammonium transporter [Campylobacterota bacterium]
MKLFKQRNVQQLASLLFGAVAILLFFSTQAFAASQAHINSGDTAWMIVATALVMLMTPAGLALFYGGMSRSKNMLNTITMSFVAYCLASIIWILWGYSLAFGPDLSGIIGNSSNFFMNGIGVKSVSGTIPTYVFVMFQMTFAAITVALVSGSIVGRMRFSSWILFSVLWLTFVYSPIAHWVWGGGWLSKLGVLDFAGGTVVHINAGVTGLIIALFLGKRKGYGKIAMMPSSITLTALGAVLLWFGWFGFNAGSELAADGLSGSAFLVTNTAAATAGLVWMFIEQIRSGKPTLLGLSSGAVAGLVAITPAAGFVNPMGSIIIGIGAGVIGYIGVTLIKNKFGYDDSLDAFGVHGLCGIWGALATGLFADPAVGGAAGLFYGNPKQLLIQFMAVIAVIAFDVIMTIIIIKIVSLFGSIRVAPADETEGLDSTIHGERAFEI